MNIDEETSSFTIEFPLHLNERQITFWLDQLGNDEGEVEPLSATTFRICCRNPRAIEKVGRSLFHTALGKKCRVVAVSGAALNQATAYPLPTQAERRKHLRR